MKTTISRRTTVAALATAALAVTATPATATSTGPDRPELRKAMNAFVDAGFTGIQLRVRDRQGDWAASAGVRKLGLSAKPPTNGSFWTGSIIKTFTATMILQLVAEGRIALDRPAADYLPGYGLDERITVRMLLRHTSGLFNYTGEYKPDGTMDEPGVPANGDAWVPYRFKSYKPEELVRLALSKKPRFEPGTQWSYSNTNYTVALLMIEKVTGRSYATELKRRITGPLGLRDTLAAGDRTRTLPGPHAHGYYQYQGKVIDLSRQNLSLLTGAGDLISTTQDLTTFFSALNGGRLLPAELLTEMRTAIPTPLPQQGYGLGIWAQDLGPGCGTVYQHNGSPPHGYGALMYSSPDGSKTLTASVTWVDSATRGPVKDFLGLVDALVKQEFCDPPAAAE
ncbi:serine hydrolase domain-containing protein [Bailinhaonella thermotolerans]|uniref:Class A beta-lactamase-related serine hydrolase n=1 Tax=Bailinhaonella thermotolerans TaxID=1070861 RepID=A0A3A4BLJ8_9ACTN|nr:serine hydrolase domain-containing protein [Bailinhaonella thermotolerans]RJL31902.1 class A beta-lactamase-related serine hydrolase [Bailinhaonella thermotolerans]